MQRLMRILLHSLMRMMRAHHEDVAPTTLREHGARGSPLVLVQLIHQTGLASILDDRCACYVWVGSRHADANYASYIYDGGMHLLQP